MKNIKVLDSSFISSLLNGKDPNHMNARKLYWDFPEVTTIVIPVTVLMEVELAYKSLNDLSFRSKLHEFFYTLEFTTSYIDSQFLENYRSLNSQMTTMVNSIDLSILTASFQYGGDLVTFDKKLLKAYNEIKH